MFQAKYNSPHFKLTWHLLEMSPTSVQPESEKLILNFKAQISFAEPGYSSFSFKYPGCKEVLISDISPSLQAPLTLRKHYSHLLPLPHSLLTFFSDPQFPACFVPNGCHEGAIRPGSLLGKLYYSLLVWQNQRGE